MYFELLFSLVGIIVGIILAHTAKEELKDGEKYFKFLSRFFYVIIMLVVIYAMIKSQLILHATIFLIVAIALFYLLYKNRNIYYSLLTYLLTGVSVYFIQQYYIVLAVLLFLYGFPIGTLGYYEIRLRRDGKRKSSSLS